MRRSRSVACARRFCAFGANHKLFECGDDARERIIMEEAQRSFSSPRRFIGVACEVTMESEQAGDMVAWSVPARPYRFTLSARGSCRCVLNALNRETLLGFLETNPETGHSFMRKPAGV